MTKDNVPLKTLNYAFWPGTSLFKRVSDGNNHTLAGISLYSLQGKMEAVSFNGGKSVTTDQIFLSPLHQLTNDYITGRFG